VPPALIQQADSLDVQRSAPPSQQADSLDVQRLAPLSQQADSLDVQRLAPLLQQIRSLQDAVASGITLSGSAQSPPPPKIAAMQAQVRCLPGP